MFLQNGGRGDCGGRGEPGNNATCKEVVLGKNGTTQKRVRYFACQACGHYNE